jgi:hypothetical protein
VIHLSVRVHDNGFFLSSFSWDKEETTTTTKYRAGPNPSPFHPRPTYLCRAQQSAQRPDSSVPSIRPIHPSIPHLVDKFERKRKQRGRKNDKQKQKKKENKNRKSYIAVVPRHFFSFVSSIRPALVFFPPCFLYSYFFLTSLSLQLRTPSPLTVHQTPQTNKPFIYPYTHPSLTQLDA